MHKLIKNNNYNEDDDSDEEEAEATSQSQHFVDGGVISTEEGVIEILSSILELGGVKDVLAKSLFGIILLVWIFWRGKCFFDKAFCSCVN